jgi:hypothetical protein
LSVVLSSVFQFLNYLLPQINLFLPEDIFLVNSERTEKGIK